MTTETKFKMEVPSLPKVPDKIGLYKTTKPSEEKQKKQLESLTSSLGLKKGLKSLSETPEGFSVGEGDHVLETYEESDSIWYSDMSKLVEEPEEPMDIKRALGVKSDDEIEKTARNRAEDFLKANDLLPKEAYPIGLEEAVFAAVELGEEEAAETVVTGVQTNFGFKLDGIDVVGPGAKIAVNFGSDGEIVGLFKAWREVKKDRSIPTIPPKEALEKFQNSKVFAELKEDSKVSVKKFYLAYYALPAFEPQEYLFPVYVFEGEVKTPSGGKMDNIFITNCFDEWKPTEPSRKIQLINMLLEKLGFWMRVSTPVSSGVIPMLRRE